MSVANDNTRDFDHPRPTSGSVMFLMAAMLKPGSV